jgi:hypothetical protein
MSRPRQAGYLAVVLDLDARNAPAFHHSNRGVQYERLHTEPYASHVRLMG